jgi:nitronate monooxygenase
LGDELILRSNTMHAILERADAFSSRFGLQMPILLAPMAGASAPALSIAIANAGGLGSCGVQLMQPDEITAWANEVRANSNGAFQLNNWIPDPPPKRDRDHEARVRQFLSEWGPAVPPEAGDATRPDFAAQCEAMLAAGPPIISSVMGLYPPDFVARLKAKGISWFAVVSTVAEARAAEVAGADVIVAQGAEAGGHRGCFDAAAAERELVGLFALLPAVVDAVRVPVVATGGIADARTVAAALLLGASAAQIGTGFLRCPEAKIHPAWAAALGETAPEGTMVSRVFSGRAGRSIATSYVRAATSDGAPQPAPYPVQRGLTSLMRGVAQQHGDFHRMQAWAGQSAALAKAEPAADLARQIWEGTRSLLE